MYSRCVDNNGVLCDPKFASRDTTTNSCCKRRYQDSSSCSSRWDTPLCPPIINSVALVYKNMCTYFHKSAPSRQTLRERQIFSYGIYFRINARRSICIMGFQRLSSVLIPKSHYRAAQKNKQEFLLSILLDPFLCKTTYNFFYPPPPPPPQCANFYFYAYLCKVVPLLLTPK